ncbi:MAG: hypothetical protein ACRDPC_27645 [Solirubrobacteraceae bacterium]
MSAIARSYARGAPASTPLPKSPRLLGVSRATIQRSLNDPAADPDTTRAFLVGAAINPLEARPPASPDARVADLRRRLVAAGAQATFLVERTGTVELAPEGGGTRLFCNEQSA